MSLDPAPLTPTVAALPTRDVIVAVKTPLMPRAATWVLPGELTLRESLDELRRAKPRDDNARQVLAQLERETSGAAFQFLVVSAQGAVVPAAAATKLHDIALEREVRTAKGLEKVPVAAFEVQAYAPVGRDTPCFDMR